MKSRLAMISVALTIAIASTTSAHQITLTEKFQPQFSVWLPNEWTVTLKDERVTAVTDDGLLWCGVWDLENTPNLRAAETMVRQRAEEMFENVAYDEPVELELEGMKGGSIEGRATHNGRDVVFFVMAFQHAEDRVGVVAFIGDPAVRKLYRTTIIDIADSITPSAEFYANAAADAANEQEE